MIRFKVAVLLFTLLLLQNSLGNTNEIGKLISKENLVLMIYKYDDLIRNFDLRNEITNYIDKNKYSIYEINNKGFAVLYLPISTKWDELYNGIEGKTTISETSFIINSPKVNYYVRLETNNYIALVGVNFVNNYNNLQKDVPNTYLLKLENFLKELSLSNISGIFAYLTGSNATNSFNLNIPIIDSKYNFLIDIDTITGYISGNEIYGKVNIKQASKLRNIYSSRGLRNINVLSDENIPFYINLSMNSELFSDILETLYPDLINTYPKIKRDIINTFSGTLFLALNNPIYQQPLDITIILGVKSKSEADKFIRSFLGLVGNYKLINIRKQRVFEIAFQGNQKIYSFLSEREFVIATSLGRLESYLKLFDEKKKSIITNFPTININGELEYIALITDNDKDIFRKSFLIDPLKKLYLELDIDDTLRYINFKIVYLN
ncbi:MAG: hypothetical protein N2712_04415 [Brevinematales bacterium]|nr:hypothetical protein [Brevinematales bacterium]